MMNKPPGFRRELFPILLVAPRYQRRYGLELTWTRWMLHLNLTARYRSMTKRPKRHAPQMDCHDPRWKEWRAIALASGLPISHKGPVFFCPFGD